MKPVKIGINKDLANQFQRSNKAVTRFLKVVNEQLAEISLNVPINELLSNPRKAIKEAFVNKHKSDLPVWMSESVILESFAFDFSYIDSKFTPKHNEILSAYNQFGCNKAGLIEPDYNYYAKNEEQLKFYQECKSICDLLNSFYDNHRHEFTMWFGMIPKAFQNYIETDISNLPYLKVNEYRITQYKNKERKSIIYATN